MIFVKKKYTRRTSDPEWLTMNVNTWEMADYYYFFITLAYYSCRKVCFYIHLKCHLCFFADKMQEEAIKLYPE